MHIQDDSEVEVNIWGGDNIGHCKKSVYVVMGVINTECLPKYSCSNLQI